MEDGKRRRPDPDELLESIREEDDRMKRGRLKIFLGMAAGVGKTYAMLQEGISLLKEGKEVLVGVAETHGRAETMELLAELPVIPRRSIKYRGITIEEFDIDAILALWPDVVLVDELAHTNAPGSRHEKRCQDVVELLDRGIDVYTTVNIQHLESRADEVENITGIKIRERVPDSIFDRADEVELVDIVPEELRKRLAEGKVYIPEKAQVAMDRFFQEGTLIALREMALHFTARLVDHDLRRYMHRKNIEGPWKPGDRLLVAVSPSPYSEYLIRWTRRTAYNLKAPWTAAYVVGNKPLSESAQFLLNKNLNLARELGAEVVSIQDEDIVSGIIRTARQYNVTQLVVGKPLRRQLRDFLYGGNLVARIIKASSDIDVHVVMQPEVTSKKFISVPVGPRRFRLREYLFAGGVVAAVTFFGKLIVPLTGHWTISLLYLFAISILSLFVGRGPMVAAAAFSALLWNFLFIPPLYTLRINSLEDAIMFVLYFTIALVTGSLTARLRARETSLRGHDRRISALFELSTSLSRSLTIDDIVETTIRHINRLFASDIAVLLAENGRLAKDPHGKSTFTPNAKEFAVARWAFDNRKPAGKNTETLSMAEARYMPLIAPGGIVGVIGMRPHDEAALSLEESNFLQAIAQQVSIAIERERLSELQKNAGLAEESDRLYRILLNSISHELRTPLTAITTAADGLMDRTIESNPDIRHSFASEIGAAAKRLNRIVEHLLDMSRIESGKMKLRSELNDVTDLIDVVVRDHVPLPDGRTIAVRLDDGLPLVPFDFILMEQALANLIHNAIVHTPPGTGISIAASLREERLLITVADTGPGLHEEELPKLFDKFYRGAGALPGGTGLGLSICKGIVEAHGGSIEAANLPAGGAIFTVRLPLNR